MNTNNLPQPAAPSADDLARSFAARQQAATAQTQASSTEGSSASAEHTAPTHRTRPAKRRRKRLRNGIIAGATAITLALGGHHRMGPQPLRDRPR